jgi:archaellum biogenesis protein FlaJ (TadC family)
MKIINKIMCVIGWITTICFVASVIVYTLYRLWINLMASSYILIHLIIVGLVIAVIVIAVMMSKKKKKKDNPYTPFYKS